MTANDVAPCPHPKAKEIKPLFLGLYNSDSDERSTLASTTRGPTPLDSASSSPRSALSIPSLIHTDHDRDTGTDSFFSVAFSECDEDRSELRVGEEDTKTYPPRPHSPLLSSKYAQSSDDLDLLPITPISTKFPSPPESVRKLVIALIDKAEQKSLWYDKLVSGASLDISYQSKAENAPYLDELRYSYALGIVKVLHIWDDNNLTTLAQDLIWCAIEPQPQSYLSLRDIKRVTLFANALKSAFLEVRGEDAFGRFVRALVNTAVVTFMGAWNIDHEKNAILYNHYLALHVQATIRLTAFIGDLYFCGLMNHICFRSCFFQVLNRLSDTYEAVMALRVLIEVIGKDKSPFWEMEYANQLLHAGSKSLENCGVACNCLRQSGVTERPDFWEGVKRFRNQYGTMFYGMVMKGGTGGMKSWTLSEGVSPDVVDAEIKFVLVQMGMGK